MVEAKVLETVVVASAAEREAEVEAIKECKGSLVPSDSGSVLCEHAEPSYLQAVLPLNATQCPFCPKP